MATKTQLVTNIKNVGWDKIALTTKGFSGAAHNYDSTAPQSQFGKIAVLFGMHDAYLVEDTDDNSLFGLEDLHAGLIKPKGFDVNDPASIDGAIILAWEEEGEVEFDEELLTKFGLNDYSVKESLKQRLIFLAQLDFMEDIDLG